MLLRCIALVRKGLILIMMRFGTSEKLCKFAPG